MPKKRSKKPNAIQLEFQRLTSDTARTKRLQELHRGIYSAAEQSHLERRRRRTLAIARSRVPNLSDSSVRLPENEGQVDLLGGNLELNTSLISERISVKPFGFGYEELCVGLLFGFLIGIQLGIELGIWNY